MSPPSGKMAMRRGSGHQPTTTVRSHLSQAKAESLQKGTVCYVQAVNKEGVDNGSRVVRRVEGTVNHRGVQG